MHTVIAQEPPFGVPACSFLKAHQDNPGQSQLTGNNLAFASNLPPYSQLPQAHMLPQSTHPLMKEAASGNREEGALEWPVLEYQTCAHSHGWPWLRPMVKLWVQLPQIPLLLAVAEVAAAADVIVGYAAAVAVLAGDIVAGYAQTVDVAVKGTAAAETVIDYIPERFVDGAESH
jgi:hypothetical protein